MIKSLMLAIRCAIASCMQSTPRCLPAQGSTPSFTCARVNQDGMVWCDLPKGLKIDYFSFPNEGNGNFYLLHDLGKGSSGRVFVVCNSRGKALVAKFFLIKDIVAHRTWESATERQERLAMLLGYRKAEAEEEMQYWKNVYNGQYDVQVRKLYGHWCLMLPYFDPILDVESRRKHLPKIRVILEHFKTKKLLYNEDDVQWRHVGIRQGQVCIFDLGSLHPCEDEESINVEKQMRILEDSIEIS